MKLKQRWKKWIAFILVFALSLSSIPVSQVQAETNATENSKDVITSIKTLAEHEVEKDLEAQNDSKSKNPAGNWYVAIHIDQLAWNFFHNKVQENINNRYSNVDTEIQIKNKYKDGKPTGKPGRADIGMILDDKTYLWEVKPMSYSIDPEKKESAIKQLNGYVDSSSEFVKGSNQITNGEVTYNTTRVRSDYIEDITYTIYYYAG